MNDTSVTICISLERCASFSRVMYLPTPILRTWYNGLIPPILNMLCVHGDIKHVDYLSYKKGQLESKHVVNIIHILNHCQKHLIYSVSLTYANQYL